MAITGEVLQHEFVSLNGIRMHYVTIGNSPLIVFLHGFPEFWYSWRHQIPFFSKQSLYFLHNHNVIAI
jgi:pimeloyl-ACP methyl ester carboxylesterase